MIEIDEGGKKVGGKWEKPTLCPDATTHLENTLVSETVRRDPEPQMAIAAP